jgi:hypothetical protein
MQETKYSIKQNTIQVSHIFLYNLFEVILIKKYVPVYLLFKISSLHFSVGNKVCFFLQPADNQRTYIFNIQVQYYIE